MTPRRWMAPIPWHRMRHVTIPIITPVIFFHLVTSVIGALQFFAIPFIMTGGNGFPANSTMFYSIYMYKNGFQYFEFGVASAMAWMLFVVTLVITLDHLPVCTDCGCSIPAENRYRTVLMKVVQSPTNLDQGALNGRRNNSDRAAHERLIRRQQTAQQASAEQFVRATLHSCDVDSRRPAFHAAILLDAIYIPEVGHTALCLSTNLDPNSTAVVAIIRPLSTTFRLLACTSGTRCSSQSWRHSAHLLSCSLVAYSLSRIPWPGRNALFILTVATLMLPFQVTLIPLFVWWSDPFVGMLMASTRSVPLIVPHWFGAALYIFLLRQFFMSIPMELSEAARIDGASEFRIYCADHHAACQGCSGDRSHLRVHRPLARLSGTADLPEQPKHVHALSWHLRVSR